jgi:hypothetical protein
MGIRFLCPNGHKLNVKSFLAGKRGVCPECGTSVDIPMVGDARIAGSKKSKPESRAQGGISNSATALLDAPTAEARANDFDDIDLPSMTGSQSTESDIDTAKTVPTEIKSASQLFATTLPDSAVPSPVVPSSSAASSSGIGLPPELASSASSAVLVGVAVSNLPPTDPITEAPMAIWYVRPPAGGQYGPARGDVMKKWIAEGRVTADSLVWREGWTDWRAANKVFPTLGTALPAVPVSDGSLSISDAPRRVILPPRKKKSSATSIAIVAILAVVCIALCIALSFVISNAAATAT